MRCKITVMLAAKENNGYRVLADHSHFAVNK